MQKKIEPVANQAVGTQRLPNASLLGCVHWGFARTPLFTLRWHLQRLGRCLRCFCSVLVGVDGDLAARRTRVANSSELNKPNSCDDSCHRWKESDPPENACTSEAVPSWIYLLCLSIKWAKLGVSAQRWDIMIWNMHLWELRCCFIGERLASSISLLASCLIKVRRFKASILDMKRTTRNS